MKHWENISTALKIAEVFGAFLGIIVAVLSIYSYIITDRTEHFNNLYYTEYQPVISRLDSMIIEPNIETIKNFKTTDEYGEFLAREISKKSAYGDIENAIRVLDSIIACYEDFFCRIDQFDEIYGLRIRQFWYAYGPHIKSQRGTRYELSYGRQIEKLAIEIWEETIRI